MSRIILNKKDVLKTHVLVIVNHKFVKTNVLYPTFELATIGGIEWRASDDLADAEKCRGIKLPQISLYLLGLEVVYITT